MRILVAETDWLLLSEMKQALEQAGYDVTPSADGMTAWDHLVGPAPPHLLVTGCRLGARMPPGTALALRAQSYQPRIPVIYISESTAELEHTDPTHGAVLVKPFAPRDLVEAVHRLLGKSV